MNKQYKDFTPNSTGFTTNDIFPMQKYQSPGVYQNQKYTGQQLQDFLQALIGGVRWYSVIANLKAETFLSEKVLYLTKGNPATFENAVDYYFDSTSMATPNDFSIVLPNSIALINPGRFIQRSA